MSKIKLYNLDRDRLEIQNLNRDKCQTIIGGMSGQSEDKSPLGSANTFSESWFCQQFPNHHRCRNNIII